MKVLPHLKSLLTGFLFMASVYAASEEENCFQVHSHKIRDAQGTIQAVLVSASLSCPEASFNKLAPHEMKLLPGPLNAQFKIQNTVLTQAVFETTFVASDPALYQSPMLLEVSCWICIKNKTCLSKKATLVIP